MRLLLKNIGQITDADIRFGDLTVFVGPQATGKSLALQFLKLVLDLGHVQEEMTRYGLDWSGSCPGSSTPILVRGCLDSGGRVRAKSPGQDAQSTFPD